MITSHEVALALAAASATYFAEAAKAMHFIVEADAATIVPPASAGAATTAIAEPAAAKVIVVPIPIATFDAFDSFFLGLAHLILNSLIITASSMTQAPNSSQCLAFLCSIQSSKY